MGLNWDKQRTWARTQHEPLQSDRAYLREHKPLTEKQRKLIVRLRTELGDPLPSLQMPLTCHEGRQLISQLLDQKKTA